MNKYKWLLIVVLMMGSGGVIEASKKTVFTNTSAKLVFEKSFSNTSLYGKVVTTVPTNWDRPFMVYVAPMKSVKMNFPFKIKRIEMPEGAQKVIQLSKNYKKEKYVVASVGSTQVLGEAHNIHIVFENDKSIAINFYLLKKQFYKNANQDIQFVDAKSHQDKLEEGSIDYLQAEITILTEKLVKEQYYRRVLLNNPVKRFEVGETIDYGDSSMTLRNISVIGNTVICTMKMTGEKYPFKKKDVILEVQNYKDMVVVENKGNKKVQNPINIDYYIGSPEYEKEFTLYFNVENITDQFYFWLEVGDFEFTKQGRNKVDLVADDINFDFMENF